jgi:hypothetical protein
MRGPVNNRCSIGYYYSHEAGRTDDLIWPSKNIRVTKAK